MGERIKAERNRQGLTLEKLSEKIGISRNYLWELEAGRKIPAVNTLFNIGTALNVSIDYLLGVTPGKENPNSDSIDTERDLKMGRIMKALDNLDTKDLTLIYNIIKSFSKYLEQK